MAQRLRSEGIVLVPALPVIGLLVYWAAHGGGYASSTWEPSALVVLGLLAATLAGLGLERLRLARPAAIALAALAAYVAWSYLSIAWAAAPGDALDGSNRALLYLLVFALFALLPWRPWTALTALTAYTLGIGTIAVLTLLALGSAADVPDLFTGARLSTPIGYVNGSAALFLSEALLAIALAARRELPVALRALLLALAAAALNVSVLCESRGWLFALPVVLVLGVALMPGRVRLVLWALAPFAGGLLALPALLDVFDRTDAQVAGAAAQATLIDAAAHAQRVALASCAGVLVVGLLLALVDRRVAVAPRVARVASRVGAALALALALGTVVVAFAATDGRPDRALADYWNRSDSYQPSRPGTARFIAVGSNRPDFWRVALHEFEAHPLGGLGQDNWGDDYLRHRRSLEQPRWTHSFELRLLAHTGIVGLLLFVLFLIGALVAALRGRRREPPVVGAVAATALLPLVVWLVHGSVDWFWEIPALSGPALGFLGLATAVAHQQQRPQVRALTPLQRRGVALAGGFAVVLGALAIALPYLAERETAAASDSWQAHPAAAFRQLDRAAQLNPLSARPALIAGVIALELGQPHAATRRFDTALQRAPGDWFARFGRGLAASAHGDRTAARADYLRARALDPREPLLLEALARLGGQRPLTAAEAFGGLRRDVQRLTGRPNRRGGA